MTSLQEDICDRFFCFFRREERAVPSPKGHQLRITSGRLPLIGGSIVPLLHQCAHLFTFSINHVNLKKTKRRRSNPYRDPRGQFLEYVARL